MSDNFAACVAFTLRPENEGAYVDNPNDPGGPTNYGITLATLRACRGQLCVAADIKALSLSDAVDIYRSKYWPACGGPNLPAGLDLMCFDFSVTAGPGRAVELLQRIIGAEIDGLPGPDTSRRAACTGVVLRTRIASMAAAQEAFYVHLHDPLFQAGWLARNRRRQAAAMQMANAAPATKGSTV